MLQELEPIIVRRFSEVSDCAEATADSYFSHSLFKFNVETSEIANNVRSARLTLTERQILERLFKARNLAVSHLDMVRDVMGYTNPVPRPSEHYRDFIASIRRKLDEIGVRGKSVIISLNGAGYLLRDTADDTQTDKGAEKTTERVFSHPDFKFYPDRLALERSDLTEMRLTITENRILKELFTNINQIVLHKRFWEIMGPEENGGVPLYNHGLIKSHISAVRKKIQLVPGEGRRIIVLKYGVGYKLVGKDK